MPLRTTLINSMTCPIGANTPYACLNCKYASDVNCMYPVKTTTNHKPITTTGPARLHRIGG